MSKVAIVYWSGTGNTEQMAESVADGARGAGAEVTVFTSAEFDADKMDEFDAMGDEVLEDTEFEPMFDGCKDALKGKNIALFGSYGWGDGEWMRNWDETCRNDGAVMACDFVICNDAPDDDAKAACEELGKALA